MAHPYWPLFDLRIRTPRLEVRIPTDDEQGELVDVIRGGVHDAATMPFLVAWTDAPSPSLGRGAMQWWWRDGLGAAEAYSGAWEDNAPSLAVSARLGYVPNGERLLLRRGQPSREISLRLPRAIWETHRRDDIEIDGLEGCREMFGL